LETVKKEGFAFCNNEYEPGLQALAVPVFNEKSKAAASLTAIAPGERFSDKNIQSCIVTALKKTAEEIRRFI
jgi:DNA-binding IclR family transcriptional regulator